ncbi:MAG: large protein, partial [Chitinophagaceae bacterium]|nr:large protein [Chitinophagaceae bacterium]
MEKLIRQLGNRSLKELATALCSLVLFFSLSTPSQAEGTKELAPTAADFNKADMHIFDVSGGITRDFMTYIADDESKLNIEICNPGEVIYFGFSYNAADITGCNKLYYRIKSPSGIIIFGPQQVTNVGAGSIGSYAQAVIGPNALVGGAGGYTALSVDPIAALIALGQAPELGSYYIEFNPNDPNTFINSATSCTGSIRPVRLPAFDITVADAPNGTPVKGRLWSKAWDLITNSFTNPFNGTMYVYADDGIVTNINFNGIQPNGFIVSCNRTGVANTGNAFNDRKSIANTNSTYGQYRIFLNDPDVDCFPTGIFGKLTGHINVTGCDQNNRCINIPVDKQGDAQLILDFNGIPGYQPGTTDRLLTTVLGVGNNCILWDSRDGLGNIVNPGTKINIQLDYFNGLTNLPMYDVENQKNGFIVNLVRPAGPAPKLFFDDTNVPGGVQNLTGCTSSLPTNGCHRWNGTAKGPDGVTNVPSAFGWGDLHTINTWWYANIITDTASYNVATIVVDADASNAAGVPNKKTVCTTTPTLALNGSVTGSSTTGVWSRVGGGGSFANANALSTTYTFSAADYLAGTIKLILTSSNNGACPPAIDTLTISVIQGPTVNAGGPVTVCANNAVIANLGGSFGGAATGATWTGGTTASFTPNRNKPTAQYSPTAGEIAATTLVLTITTTGSGICPEVSATKTITFSTPPSVVMGPDVTVCANNAAATVTATPSNATSVLWSGGAAGSSFVNGATNSATYNPAPAEKTAAPTSVTLTFKASKAGCTDASGTLKVNITPTPVMNAGPNRSICANDSINLVGTRTNAPSSVWSSPTATATSFKPNATNLSTNYKPTAADIANGTVVISLTSSGNNCTPVVSTMTLTITPAPTINAGTDKLVCANNPVTTLTAVTTAPGVQWYSGAGSYSASNTSNPLTYTLNAAEVASTSTGLVVKTTGGTCPPVTDTVFIFVTPAPTVTAGPDLPSCANNATVQVTGATTSAAGMTWTTLNGGTFNNTAIINPFFTPSATDISAAKATIIITANQAGCLPVRDTALVIIDPTPVVSAGPNR